MEPKSIWAYQNVRGCSFTRFMNVQSWTKTCVLACFRGAPHLRGKQPCHLHRRVGSYFRSNKDVQPTQCPVDSDARREEYWPLCLGQEVRRDIAGTGTLVCEVTAQYLLYYQPGSGRLERPMGWDGNLLSRPMTCDRGREAAGRSGRRSVGRAVSNAINFGGDLCRSVRLMRLVSV